MILKWNQKIHSSGQACDVCWAVGKLGMFTHPLYEIFLNL